VDLVNARPAKDHKKGADTGINGYINFFDDKSGVAKANSDYLVCGLSITRAGGKAAEPALSRAKGPDRGPRDTRVAKADPRSPPRRERARGTRLPSLIRRGPGGG
jgi:hypothetical protein